jgi:hypothetical protein
MPLNMYLGFRSAGLRKVGRLDRAADEGSVRLDAGGRRRLALMTVGVNVH